MSVNHNLLQEWNPNPTYRRPHGKKTLCSIVWQRHCHIGNPLQVLTHVQTENKQARCKNTTTVIKTIKEAHNSVTKHATNMQQLKRKKPNHLNKPKRRKHNMYSETASVFIFKVDLTFYRVELWLLRVIILAFSSQRSNFFPPTVAYIKKNHSNLHDAHGLVQRHGTKMYWKCSFARSWNSLKPFDEVSSPETPFQSESGSCSGLASIPFI